MAELAILTVDRDEIVPVHLRAVAGDPEAQREIDGLWAAYRGREIECFTCGGLVDTDAPFTFLMPDKAPGKMMATPLCRECADLPEFYRWGKALKVLKRMWPGARFNFTPRRR